MSLLKKKNSRFENFLDHRSEFIAFSTKPGESGKYRFVQSGKNGIIEDVLLDDLVEGFDKFVELKNDLGYSTWPSSPDGIIAIHPEGQ